MPSILLRALGVFLLASSTIAQTVVCVGDSITEGDGHHAWPALLAERLGSGGRVVNLGVSSATMLSDTDRPYLGTRVWRDAERHACDVAIVMLGTNDTVLNESRRPWSQVDSLERDVLAMLTALRTEFAPASILLCSPPPVFPAASGLPAERARDLAERAPRLVHVAAVYRTVAEREADVEFVDITRALSASQVTDGVHLSPFGAASIADHLAAMLRTPRARPSPTIRTRLTGAGISFDETTYHGFARVDFVLPERDVHATIVAPHRVSAGRPWIWRARFFGHEPALDLALLERGFHLAYCDVANLYGAPEAVARWETFHAFAHSTLDLAPKPILHGLSRGGMPALNFAIAHPDRVAALVLDNAVCDVRSWPGGEHGKRSDADWTRLLAAYGITEGDALPAEARPLDQLASLAEERVPLHILIGMADVVVPPHENGDVLVARYDELGGPVTAWRKPGAGHHPHGLRPVAPLARALLRLTGVDTHNPAAVALPSVESRGAPAGWGAGGSWRQQVEAMRATAETKRDIDVVFLGDSITQGLTGASQRVTSSAGTRPIDRFARTMSLGLSGDRTEHLLHRIEHGALALLSPRLIVLQIGVNNINTARHTGDEVADGLKAVVASLRRNEPQSDVLICGPFPTGHEPDDPRRASIDRVHECARALADDDMRVEHLDLRPLFLDDDGRPNTLMRGDAIHISPAGQAAWMEAIEEKVMRALGG